MKSKWWAGGGAKATPQRRQIRDSTKVGDGDGVEGEIWVRSVVRCGDRIGVGFHWTS